MIITIVGVGLIGGSMAITLKENGFADKIIGVDQSQENLDKAIRRRLIDTDMKLEVAVKESDLIIISIPVNSMLNVLPRVLDMVTTQVVMDVGSTKLELVNNIEDHPNRKQFVGTHPMAGTEFSGPEAAIPNLFDHKTTVICDAKQSSPSAVRLVEEMYNSLKMNVLHMDS